MEEAQVEVVSTVQTTAEETSDHRSEGCIITIARQREDKEEDKREYEKEDQRDDTIARKKVLAAMPFLTYNHSVISNLICLGLDQEMATILPYSWSPELILGAFCIIFRA